MGATTSITRRQSVWLYLDLVIVRQPHSGLGMLILCQFFKVHAYFDTHTQGLGP